MAKIRRTYFVILAAVKSCRVCFRDRAGVEHGVYVTAVNRYHAFALGMLAMRRCSWSNPDYHQVDQMTIQLLEGGRWPRVKVTREQFEKWLGKPEALASNDRLRRNILMLLGRMEPDRAFKRGLSNH